MSNEQAKWLDLMKWSMKQSKGAVDPNPKDIKEIDEDKKRFLEAVMRDGVIDIFERMKCIIRILKGEDPKYVFGKKDVEGEETEEEPHTGMELAEYKESLLDELLTIVDQLDNAQTFAKIEGLDTLLKLLNDERPTTRSLAAEVFATTVQNNPPCQLKALELGSINYFRTLLLDTDPTCQVKALLAISSLIRGSPVTEGAFLGPELNGIGLLKTSLQTSNVRLQRKGLFLFRYLMGSNPENADLIYEAGFPFEAIMSMIGHADVDLCEGSLEAMVEFSSNNSKGMTLLQQQAPNVLPLIEERLSCIEKMVGEDAEYAQHELATAKRLKSLLEK